MAFGNLHKSSCCFSVAGFSQGCHCNLCDWRCSDYTHKRLLFQVSDVMDQVMCDSFGDVIDWVSVKYICNLGHHEKEKKVGGRM